MFRFSEFAPQCFSFIPSQARATLKKRNCARETKPSTTKFRNDAPKPSVEFLTHAHNLGFCTGVDMVSVTETGVSISPIDHFQVTITTGEHPPCFTPIDPQNPPKTLKFRSKFKVCVCLTVCNHACTTLPRAGRPSLYIPRIPSRPPGALESIETPRMRLKNTCGVHIYSFVGALRCTQ